MKNVIPKRENQSTILTRLAKTGSTSISIKTQRKGILVIDFDSTFLNEWGTLMNLIFGISKPNNNNTFKLLSKVTVRGYWKLNPLELIGERFGRSIFNDVAVLQRSTSHS